MRRTAAGTTALAMILSLAITPMGHAQTPIPAVVQVEDPLDDSNFLNDQDNAYGTPLEGQGDHTTPADVGNASDFLKIWFSHTATTISIHFQTQLPAPATQDLYYRFANNATADEPRGCVFWILIVNGTGAGGQGGLWVGPDTAIVEDSCIGADPVEATFTIEEGPEGTGIATITAPRTYTPLFADNSVLTGVFGVSRFLVVGPGLPEDAAPNGFATGATADTTVRGTDYTVSPVGAATKKCTKKARKSKKCPSPSPSPAMTASPAPSPSST